MKSLLDNLFGFQRPSSAGEILWFKAFEAFVAASVITWVFPWAQFIGQQDGASHPIGIASYLSLDFLYRSDFAFALAGLTSLAAILAVLRISPAWSWGFTLLGTALAFTLRFSVDKPIHSTHFVGYGLLALTLGFAVGRTRHEQRRIAWGVTLWLMGLAYTSAALCKLGATGPGWVDGEQLWLWMGKKLMVRYSDQGYWQQTWIQTLLLQYEPLATLALGSGLLVELLGVGLWWRVSRPWIALGIFGLHFGIFVAMTINFSPFVMQVAIMALPFPWLIDRFLARHQELAHSSRLQQLTMRIG